jgi:hypothetical protein
MRVMNPIQSALTQLDRNSRRAYHREYKKECLKYPDRMKALQIPEDMMGAVLGNWRSNKFLAVAWPSDSEIVLCRLSVNRVDIDDNGNWLQGISWDDLYRIKNECGYEDYDAVEVYPAQSKLVNVANIRHLWVLAQRLPFTLEG